MLTIAVLIEEKTKGRKRHIVIDTKGNLLSVHVHAANKDDTKSGVLPLKRAYFVFYDHWRTS